MSLIVGDWIGPYELIGPLGEGGMGRVWRARDPRLGRDVAIKVLPDAFAGDGDRLARFTRESQILAALNHPHIATIHGVEETAVGHAIVMELIPGPTLADRLQDGPVPPDEALALARDIAGALEAAHDRGIVHRDLKPANFKFTEDGRLKVLDFGLAKSGVGAGAPALARSPTTVGTTETGVLLGTAAYMSPEQARGAAVDRRADVWSFGCVLYEMLTGRPVFRGTTVADVLAAVLTVDPDWSALPGTTPPAVVRLLRRCLRREPRQRLRDMGDVQLVLDDVISGRETDGAAVVEPSPAPWRVHAVWLVAGLALLAAGYFFGSRSGAGPGGPPLRKLEVAIQDPVLDIFTRPRISPDGRAIVYGATNRLWVRRLDRLEPREVPGSRLAEAPFWSADGTAVAFARQGRLWRVAIDGTDPIAVCDLPPPGRIISGAWRDDDTIVFGAWQGSAYEVPARGGDPRQLLTIDTKVEVDFHELTPLPRNRGLLFVRHERAGELQHIELFANGRRSILLRAHGPARYDSPRFDPGGYLVYERLDINAGIWAAPFSLDTLALTGEPFRVAPGGSMPSVSLDGTLVYAEQSVTYELAWIDRDGERIERVGSAQPELQSPALSADGRRVAVAAADEARVQDRDIWLVDAATGRRQRLQAAPTPTRDVFPTWAPDGGAIVYLQARRDPTMLVVARADGTGVTDITPASGRASFSADGRHLIYSRATAADRADVWWLDVSGGGFTAPQLYLRDGARNLDPAFSPDGRTVAYSSNRSGEPQVYLGRFPPGGEHWRVTNDGGSNPSWNASGTELFYRAPDDRIMVVPVSTTPAVTIGTPSPAIDAAASGATTVRGFGISRDGRRILVVRRSDAGHNMHLVVVEHWLAEFQR